MKRLVFLVLVIFYFGGIFSQPSDKDTSYLMINNVLIHKDSITFPYDPLDLGYKQYVTNDFAFLITDTIYYTFRVYDIHRLKNGYFISMVTRICDTNVYAQVVSMKTKGKFEKHKIKVGQTYEMKLNRYFEKPLRTSFTNKMVYDVMLGKNSVGILSTGRFTYLFVSQNLDGLKFIDSTETIIIENHVEEKFQELQNFAYEVIKSISFKEDTLFLLQYIDTQLVEKSLQQYSTLYMYYHISAPTPLNPPKRIPTFEWKNYHINTKTFNSWFWGLLKKQYNLPQSKEGINHSFSEDDFEMKVLYYKDNIYTVRIKWQLPSDGKIKYAFLAIEERDDGFKVIGFNKSW